jgi:Zn-dependent M28 family amino/carboxypeptidase
MKKILFILLFILLFLSILVFIIKQPIFIKSVILENVDKMVKSDEKKLEKHVRNLSSYERFSDSWLDKASKYILKVLEEDWINKNNIEIQKYNVWNREFKNIIVHFKSFHNIKKLDNYIVGAHYDSHEKLPGADDNASWISWLLEIASILNNQKRLDKNIDLVFYSTEEMPNFRTENMWSYQHAKNSKDIKMAIILEMIGYFSEEKWSQNFPIEWMKYLYSDTWNYITIVSNFENLFEVRKIKGFFNTYLKKNNIIYVDSINAPSSIPWIDFSDHQSYWKFDIPAIMITDTAFYRNKNYHTKDDTYDKLNYKKMKEVVDSVVVSLLSL